MSVVEKIKEIAVSGKTLRFGIESMQKAKLRKELRDFEDQEFVALPLVEALLQDYIIIPKQNDLFGVEAIEDVIAWMHGKTVVNKQKLRELGELLKTRPETMGYPYARKPWCNPEKSAKCFELLEKKWEELNE